MDWVIRKQRINLWLINKILSKNQEKRKNKQKIKTFKLKRNQCCSNLGMLLRAYKDKLS